MSEVMPPTSPAPADPQTMAEAGDVSASDARMAPVKGVTAPLSLAAIVWT